MRSRSAQTRRSMSKCTCRSLLRFVFAASLAPLPYVTRLGIGPHVAAFACARWLSLQARLHASSTLPRRVLRTDTSIGNRRFASTTRKAWFEVRDYTEREIDSREAFIHALQTTVVAPLTGLRDTQTRIRNRIREGLKEATEQYESYVFSKVPKLEKTYRSKEQALEEIRKQEAAVAKQQLLLSEANPALPEKQPHPYMSAAASVRDGHSIRAPSISRSRRSSGSLESDDPNFPSPNSPTSQSGLPPPSYHSAAPSIHITPQQQQGYHPSALSPAATIPDRKTPIHFSGVQSGRSRSGSASGLTLRDVDARSKEIMNDLAAHGKKSFKSLMDRMAGDREGAPEKTTGDVALSPPDASGLQGRRGSVRSHSISAMKSVKARREAEEADKAYRKGVFHTETLRLRREKLQTSAIQSLTDLNEELNINLRAALAQYVTHAHATAITLAQATEVAGAAIKRINLEQDGMQFRSRLPPIVKNKPVVYQNYHVGPCQSLIFGVSLTDYDFARGEGGDHGRPPLIVEKCIARIDAFGLETEGIYRISGRVATVRDMVQEIERTETHFQFKPTYDVHSIAGVLKQYLRELPDPLFPLPLAERVKMTADRQSYLDDKFAVIRSRLRRLPPIHQTTLRAIIEHLSRVADHADVNKMDARNLAVVFNSVLFGPEKQMPENGEALMQMQTQRDTVLEDMITHCDLIFGPGTTPLSYHSGEYDYGYDEGEESESDAPREREKEKERNAGPGASRTKLVLITPRDDLSDDSEPPVNKLTPDSALSLLFDPSLIPQSMLSQIPSEFHLRPLASDDFLRAHFALLSTLSQSPALAPSAYANLFNALKASGIYYILVLVDKATDELVMSGTLLLERKFSHGGGLSGHIEDIIVSERLQGRGLGQILVRGLRELAANLGAYKVILDCQERMVPFYEKCGFAIRGRQMAHYVESLPPPRKESLTASRVLGGKQGEGAGQGGQGQGNGHGHGEGQGGEGEAEGEEDGRTNDGRLDDIDAETEASDVTYHFPVTA